MKFNSEKFKEFRIKSGFYARANGCFAKYQAKYNLHMGKRL